MVYFEKEVIKFLGLPSIPKKEHDGKTPFDKGVAILKQVDGSEAYASCSFNPERGDKEPRITKVFGSIPFNGIKSVFVVPNYMAKEEDVDNMDLDAESKKKAKEILKEAEELENDGTEEDNELKSPKNEYYFDHITNDEEAKAFIRSYNSCNHIKGKIPSTHDGIVMRLAVIFSDTKKASR